MAVDEKPLTVLEYLQAAEKCLQMSQRAAASQREKMIEIAQALRKSMRWEPNGDDHVALPGGQCRLFTTLISTNVWPNSTRHLPLVLAPKRRGSFIVNKPNGFNV
jgi:hypothetical protein